MKKSEMGGLFHRLATAFAPETFPPFRFPHRVIAQARAWRGYPVPDLKQLTSASEALALEKIGVLPGEVELLVTLGEAFFRPMRAVELELEPLLPEFFKSHGSFSGAEFSWLWEEKARAVGKGWVLAAGRRPVWITGRPSLIAPKVVGAVVSERLQLDGTDQPTALQRAADFETLLSGRPVKPSEVDHWRARFRRVQVRRGHDAISLTRFLAYPLEALGKDRVWFADKMVWWTPSDILEAYALPVSTSAQVAGLFWRGPHRPREKQGGAPATTLYACHRCESEEMYNEGIDRHLTINHGIPQDLLYIPEGRAGDLVHEYRHTETKELLATWRTGPATVGPKTPPPTGQETR